jgi:AcrR family transcriptional regulator
MSTLVNLKKQDIYTAAARLFKEKGYPSTSMRELASAVGMEASSLYNHIRSKAELLEHICFHTAEGFTKGMEAIRSKGDSPVEQIRALIHLHVEIAIDDPSSQTVFNDEWRHLTPEKLAIFLEMRRNYEQDFLNILEEARQQGILREIPSTTILRTIVSAMRWIHPGKSVPTPASKKQLAEELGLLLIHGFSRVAPHGA